MQSHFLKAGLFLCLIGSAVTKKPLFAFQISESDTAGEYEMSWSFESWITADAKLKRSADEGGVRYTADGRVQVEGRTFMDVNASLDMQPIDGGYDVRSEARVQSAGGVSGVYLLQARRLFQCPRLRLAHNITTVPDHVLAFSSQLEETCGSAGDSRIHIDLDVSSSFSHSLSTQLQQVFVFGVTSGWESMNATNPLIDVAVEAQWSGDQQTYHHKKTATFHSKQLHWLFPTFSLNYENDAGHIILTLMNQAFGQKRDEL